MTREDRLIDYWFGPMTLEQVADRLRCSTATVSRDWRELKERGALPQNARPYFADRSQAALRADADADAIAEAAIAAAGEAADRNFERGSCFIPDDDPLLARLRRFHGDDPKRAHDTLTLDRADRIVRKAVRPARAMGGAVAAALVFLLALAIPMPARAHDAGGNANWIAKGSYRDRVGIHCCGVGDCFSIAPEDVETTPQGYRLKTYGGEIVPFSEATPAEADDDGVMRFWRCKKYDGSRRCFFAPFGGS